MTDTASAISLVSLSLLLLLLLLPPTLLMLLCGILLLSLFSRSFSSPPKPSCRFVADSELPSNFYCPLVNYRIWDADLLHRSIEAENLYNRTHKEIMFELNTIRSNCPAAIDQYVCALTFRECVPNENGTRVEYPVCQDVCASYVSHCYNEPFWSDGFKDKCNSTVFPPGYRDCTFCRMEKAVNIYLIVLSSVLTVVLIVVSFTCCAIDLLKFKNRDRFEPVQ